MKKQQLIVLVMAVIALMLAGCGGANPFAAAPTATSVPVVTDQGTLNVEGRVVPKVYASLAFPVSGEVETVSVAEGDTVQQGTKLVGLGKREQLQAALSAAKLEQLTAQQDLDALNRDAGLMRTQAEEKLTAATKVVIDAREELADLDTDSYKDTLDTKETAVQNAMDKLSDAEEELEKRKDLDPDNQTRKTAEDNVENAQKEVDAAVRDRDLWKNQIDQAKAKVAQAEAALADAQTDVDNRATGPDPDDLALAQSRLENANDAVKSAERALENMDLTAPFDGTIADLNGLAVGQWLASGRTAVTLADFSEWYVETKDLTELDVVSVEVGQSVTLRLDALPDAEITGVVTAIKPAYTERSGDVLYTVRIRLNPTAEDLLWGMTAQVSFE